jgi:hypothetical protein
MVINPIYRDAGRSQNRWSDDRTKKVLATKSAHLARTGFLLYLAVFKARSAFDLNPL